MVNRVLTSPYLWWSDPFFGRSLPCDRLSFSSAGATSMAMTASSGVAQDDGSQNSAGQSERSPFARVTELLAPHTPGKPLIMLSLGEPQHPIPAFVGPVLAKNLADFGRYPLARGIEPFRRGGGDTARRRGPPALPAGA